MLSVGPLTERHEENVSDTSAEASALQTTIHRGLSSVERLSLAVEMSEMVRALSVARLSREHPDWSDSQLNRELLRYAFHSTSTTLPAPLL